MNSPDLNTTTKDKKQNTNIAQDQIKSLQKNNFETNVVLRDILNSLSNLSEKELKSRIERAHQLLCASEQGIQDMRNTFKSFKGSKTIFSDNVWNLLDKIESLSGTSPQQKELEAMVQEHFQKKDTQTVDAIEDESIQNEFDAMNIKSRMPNDQKSPVELSTNGISRQTMDRLTRQLRESEQENDLLVKQMEKSRRDCEYWRRKCNELEKSQNPISQPTKIHSREEIKSSKTHENNENIQNLASYGLTEIKNNSKENFYINTERGRIKPYDLIQVWAYDSMRLKKKRTGLETKISFLKLQATGYQEYIALLEQVLKLLDILPRNTNRPVELSPKAKLEQVVLAVYFITCTRIEADKSRKSKTYHRMLFKD